MIRAPWLKVVVMVAGCAPLGAFSADRLNIKTGLWEIKSILQTSGVLPLPKALLDTLTPEQRAKMAADMKAEAAKGPSSETTRECITDKDLEQPFSSANTKECRQSVVSTSRTAQEVRIVCDGEVKGGGVMKVNSPTPETMTGSIDLKVGQGADAFSMNGKLIGRWLGADCGDEADGESVDEDGAPADDSEEEE
jgi:hypothetical protein